MKRNKFDLSHYRLTSADMGNLLPIACVECLPGDTIQQATSVLLRCAPLNSPVMHPVDVRVHHWFVPHRLVWNDPGNTSFEEFITGGADGNDSSTPPTMAFTAAGLGQAAKNDLAAHYETPIDRDWETNQ